MTKENRELLFIDLCARLPYGVKIKVTENNDFVDVLDCYYLDNVNNNFYSIRPYLFPLSSMTDEQEKELFDLGWCLHLCEDLSYDDCAELIDWLNAHHLDYRGLIEKGLAIDATGKGIY